MKFVKLKTSLQKIISRLVTDNTYPPDVLPKDKLKNLQTINLCRIGGTGNLTTNVRLRRDPNTNTKFIATHYKGAKIQILAVREGEFARGSSYWYRVKVLSKGCGVERPNVSGSEGSATEGWMHSTLISCD